MKNIKRENRMNLLDKEFLKVTPLFPTYDDLAYLMKDLDTYYENCMSAISCGDAERYQDNYIAINQTHSLLSYLENKNIISGNGAIGKIQDKMFVIQTFKRELDELGNPIPII